MSLLGGEGVWQNNYILGVPIEIMLEMAEGEIYVLCIHEKNATCFRMRKLGHSPWRPTDSLLWALVYAEGGV